ncbi:MAG: uroporphyrinogen-III C-methyltransferase, partial [Clostridia bacterium]|nr:uroporphyrinogen-III C-methyltransferase [Clostridia bacterium]
MSGRVYLVGAGPGDPGLLTLKGAACLERADVVVHDRLVDPRVLALARPDAELIDAGKEPGEPKLTQEAINALLVERARRGQVVVRLKGGDPFIFGRGGEEALALAEAGVPFEVVPGVSSVSAVPAYAGIPLTFRGLSSAFLVLTGHRCTVASGDDDPDWESLARAADTLVVLMGMSRLGECLAGLRRGGRDPSTPAAVIAKGTLGEQRVVVADLARLADEVAAAGLRNPAIAVVGPVVSLRERLAWFERRPLFGRRILVTRSREQAGQLSRLLAEQGAQPVEVPLIRAVPPASWEEFDAALTNLAHYRWVAFTSANAVRAFGERLWAAGRDARALAGVSIACVGGETDRALRGWGLRADLVPETFNAAALAAVLC